MPRNKSKLGAGGARALGNALADGLAITIASAGYGKRGQLFNASVDGRTIISASVTPFFGAARIGGDTLTLRPNGCRQSRRWWR